ncbi:hypothetical protein [Methylosinus sporium]|uniref:Uncharacterized protein n=1 Tax=Methylosinus sporium TaxID=428 RepID=A0A2U1SRS2_METSR|nr:hypothetical protein [Methylosinus sporium]PWB94300.1 hypothetical protein C5689_08215 [Methylosinus sporium]
MAEPPRKEFGRRGLAPPVVTHAPEGLPGGANGPFGSRKRTIAIAAIAVGSLSIGTYAAIEYAHTVALIAAGSLSIGTYAAIEYAHGRDCAEDADWERQEECRQSHSHGGSGGHSSSGESSAGHAGAASSGHAVSFGGFGAAGHGGGGS